MKRRERLIKLNEMTERAVDIFAPALVQIKLWRIEKLLIHCAPTIYRFVSIYLQRILQPKRYCLVSGVVVEVFEKFEHF